MYRINMYMRRAITKGKSLCWLIVMKCWCASKGHVYAWVSQMLELTGDCSKSMSCDLGIHMLFIKKLTINLNFATHIA